MEHFFSPNSSEHLRSDAHQSQIIGGDADVKYTQTIGGDTAKLLGGISPPGFGTPDWLTSTGPISKTQARTRKLISRKLG